LSAVFGAVFAASGAAVVLAYAVGAEGAVEDTLLGAFLACTAIAGLLGALAAFVLAVVAKAERERWALLWLPLCSFPVFLLFLLLGEALWWE
jgi:hypothetical protein